MTGQTNEKTAAEQKRDQIELELYQAVLPILRKHDVATRSAQQMMDQVAFMYQHALMMASRPLIIALEKMPPSKFYEKEQEIKALVLQTVQDIALLTK